jgi:ParB family chromosome partitioning protein
VDLNDVEAAEWGLIENLQREDLGTMERAAALAGLARQFGLTHVQIAERVGLDRSTVTNLIRLTELEPPIQALIEAERLSAGHGKALLGAMPGPSRVSLAERAALGVWSVRRLEQAAMEHQVDEATSAPTLVAASADDIIRSRARDLSLREIERRLQEHLGTKAMIKTDRTGTRGRVVLRFYGLDQFEGLLVRMGISKP